MANCNQITDSRSIGIFDSGIGGLAIARSVRERLPHESIIYVADSGHAPYGDKSEQAIVQRSFAVTDFLQSRNVKAVVVACNTATTTCIESLRARYPLPFIGVEPGIKPAVLNTQSGVVGVLATAKTLVTDSFVRLAQRIAGDVKIEIQPCPDLVTTVEELKLDGQKATAAVKKVVLPLIEKGADTIVLGCTHYSHLASVIAKVAGPDISIVSTEGAVAQQVARRLESEGLSAPQSSRGIEEFWTTGAIDRFQKQIDRLWPMPVRARRL